MTNIAREIVVSCPPERVFALLTDIERLPEIADMTVAVRNGPGRPIQTGDRFEQIIKVLGIEIETDWEVTELEANTKIRIEGRSKSNGRATLTEHVTAEGDGCRVQLEVDYDPPLGLLGDIADKAIFERRHEEEAEHILTRLKELCETTQQTAG